MFLKGFQKHRGGRGGSPGRLEKIQTGADFFKRQLPQALYIAIATVIAMALQNH